VPLQAVEQQGTEREVFASQEGKVFGPHDGVPNLKRHELALVAPLQYSP
jgi:hypothetical protein